MIPSHREPTHPGEMLLEEFLRPLGLSQVSAAARMRIPLNRLNEIIRGKRGVTADTAIRLARLLETSPEFWMNLQSAWDIYHAAKNLHVDLEAAIRELPRAVAEPGETWTTIAWTETPAAEPVEAGPPQMVKATTTKVCKDLEMVA